MLRMRLLLAEYRAVLQYLALCKLRGMLFELHVAEDKDDSATRMTSIG
jgi:hypothetical protein